jgi:hypothetical protein
MALIDVGADYLVSAAAVLAKGRRLRRSEVAAQALVDRMATAKRPVPGVVVHADHRLSMRRGRQPEREECDKNRWNKPKSSPPL